MTIRVKVGEDTCPIEFGTFTEAGNFADWIQPIVDEEIEIMETEK